MPLIKLIDKEKYRIVYLDAQGVQHNIISTEYQLMDDGYVYITDFLFAEMTSNTMKDKLKDCKSTLIPMSTIERIDILKGESNG